MAEGHHTGETAHDETGKAESSKRQDKPQASEGTLHRCFLLMLFSSYVVSRLLTIRAGSTHIQH